MFPVCSVTHVPGLYHLANYTHRIALTNSRIVAFDGEHVTFRYRDYRAGNTDKTMTLDADEFLRRFLMHVVPSRFVRIRYYGFMANRVRAESITQAHALIGHEQDFLLPAQRTQPDKDRCPRCGQGTMLVIGPVQPQLSRPSYEDSS
jgi:hypothetical protein